MLVIGDIILDQYLQGNVSRISPEAPVPVVLVEKDFSRMGGAANVSNNLRSLDARVTQIGRVGKDQAGRNLIKHLKKSGVDTSLIIKDSKLPTITKTRVIAQHQQVVRIDQEQTAKELPASELENILRFLDKNLKDYDAVIISDYGKGMITPELVREVCKIAGKQKKVITVDPKVEHFGYYRNVTAITPNKKEAENAIRNIKIRESSGKNLKIFNDKLTTEKLIDQAGQQLLNYLQLDALLLTLGEQGMKIFEKGKRPIRIETEAQEVFDVTGAGDTVISVFTLALTCGATKLQAAQLANSAAGIVVGKIGAATVTRDELKEGSRG